ncbi:MAG: aminopeptidase P family protein [Chloroflexi bacterium]|nr:aminopeptidase P family protein [Chloroflexota bacterium]MBK6712894.1 aminopeptidase P family protein [Chloroflexota bacterium]MBK7177502.1 aminopeptidase P family protein [Chloroflexota bacterium]MBK8931888.1 aminopeptidase P family protein [Chloroflexota bacterium]
MNQTRVTRLQQEMKTKALDGVILMPGPNQIYFSHMHTHISERPILLFLPAAGAPAAIIPVLEAMKARDAGIPEERIFAWTDVEWYEGAFASAAAALHLDGAHWGVEALYMRVLEYEALQKVAPALRTSHAEPAIMALRAIKDADELAAMERAVGVAERAIERLIPQIQIGQTEKQVAGMLTGFMQEEGADTVAFSPIVSTGPNGASPHATPTDRPLADGDFLVVDWGAYVDGYPSDITRTFAVGHVDAEMARIYDVVRESNAQGKLAAKPGATGEDVDRAARQVIEDAGYGKYFIHRTGHGLGLEVHEMPSMVAGNREPLAVGNVFTVEPGIYLPGRGGVRIEDDVVITADGRRSLTSFTRELITVG